ncbi:MAG: hypothetical protein R3236_09480, partial [Phycisphaeraceae bacterium]|nr:hypothetical protein [Phycisphaeraceae bacterium]
MARFQTATLLIACFLAGCGGFGPRVDPVAAVYRGDHGRARVVLQKNLPPRNSSGQGFDRDYMLQRLRLMIAMLCDGYTVEADPVIGEVYEVLTTQGLNADKTVSAVVVNENVKTWKGEPFEQALTYHYIATHWAMQQSWDNARAAINRSLFHLRDISDEMEGKVSNEQLATKAARMDNRNEGAGDKFLNNGYVARESNFTLGYLMRAIANQQLFVQNGDDRRLKEAADNYAAALRQSGNLEGLVKQLRNSRAYNTLLVVDYGRGPRKIATGPDGAVSAYRDVMSSDGNRLAVRVGTGPSIKLPWVCDVNVMARDHRWNNLEDVRLAKSFIGKALMAAAAATAANTNSRSGKYAAIGMLAAGALARAGARADTRYCEMMPQRVYLVPVMIQRADQPVHLEVENHPQSRMVLRGIKPPPADSPVAVRYIRLVSARPGAEWARSGTIFYSNDQTGPVETKANYPFILGGNSVRRPSDEALASYQKSGYCRGMSLQELEDLYRVEGIYYGARDNEDGLGL